MKRVSLAKRSMSPRSTRGSAPRGASAATVLRAAISLCTVACFCLYAAAATGAAAPLARSARTISLSETGQLHLTSKHVFTLNEQGSATGTIKGTIYIHLHLPEAANRVTAEVNIYPHGGSLSGHGSASYEVEGADAVFSGQLAITSGSGSYAHASASDLRFTGSIERRNDAVSVRLSGQLSV
jgi:hypothetical protein